MGTFKKMQEHTGYFMEHEGSPKENVLGYLHISGTLSAVAHQETTSWVRMVLVTLRHTHTDTRAPEKAWPQLQPSANKREKGSTGLQTTMFAGL